MKLVKVKISALVVFASALLVLFVSSCATNKPSVSQESELDKGKTLGVVTNEFEKDGCLWLIKLEGQNDTYLIPVQLEDKFKKNGLKVEFAFHYSRISQGACQIGQPAVLEDIMAK
jgi:hypothetical protein